MSSYYDLLIMPVEATAEQLRDAYQLQRARLQADLSLSPTSLDEQLNALDEAFSVLSDPLQKAAYDRMTALTSSGETNTKALAVAGEGQRPPPIVLPADHQAPSVMITCPHCGNPNPVQATICNSCGQQVSRPCPKCGLPVILGQSVCPRCQTYIPEQDQRRFAEGMSISERVQNERIESESRVRTLEAAHRARATMGIAFYLVLCLVCSGAAGIAYLVYTYLMAL